MFELNHTILSAKSPPTGREAFVGVTNSEVQVGNFNIFGFNGSSSVEGFRRGTTDIVPSQPLSATHDILCGGTGNDTILSGSDRDPAFGEGGNNLVRGGGGSNQVNGAARADPFFGDENNDKLIGGTGTDRCDGGSGTDSASTCETRIHIS